MTERSTLWRSIEAARTKPSMRPPAYWMPCMRRSWPRSGIGPAAQAKRPDAGPLRPRASTGMQVFAGMPFAPG